MVGSMVVVRRERERARAADPRLFNDLRRRPAALLFGPPPVSPCRAEAAVIERCRKRIGRLDKMSAKLDDKSAAERVRPEGRCESQGRRRERVRRSALCYVSKGPFRETGNSARLVPIFRSQPTGADDRVKPTSAEIASDVSPAERKERSSLAAGHADDDRVPTLPGRQAANDDLRGSCHRQQGSWLLGNSVDTTRQRGDRQSSACSSEHGGGREASR